MMLRFPGEHLFPVLVAGNQCGAASKIFSFSHQRVDASLVWISFRSAGPLSCGPHRTVDVPPQINERTANRSPEREHSENTVTQQIRRRSVSFSCCCVFFCVRVIVDVCCHVYRLDDSFRLLAQSKNICRKRTRKTVQSRTPSP